MHQLFYQQGLAVQVKVNLLVWAQTGSPPKASWGQLNELDGYASSPYQGELHPMPSRCGLFAPAQVIATYINKIYSVYDRTRADSSVLTNWLHGRNIIACV